MNNNQKKIVLFHGHHGYYHRPYHWVPTHMLFLSALLVEKGYEPVIIDENNFYHDGTCIDALIQEALFCGVSATTGNQITRGIDFSKKVRALRPDCKIIWGGPHVSALPLESLCEDYIDMVCTGRGELTLVALASVIENNSSLLSVPGIYFKNNARVKRNKVVPPPKLKEFQPLPYDILNMNGYLNPETMVMNYQSSIGCIGSCSFCYWYGKHPIERKDLDVVFDEIEHLYKTYNLTSIYFDDPDFFQGRSFVRQFLDRLENSSLRFHWGACGRPDVLSKYPEEIFQKAADLGLHRIFVGMESGSPKMLKKLNKGTTQEQMLRAAELTKDMNIELYLGIIVGVLGETIDDLILSGEIIQKLRHIKTQIGYQVANFTPYPGLPLTKELEQIGRPIPTSLADWATLERRSFPDIAPPFWIQDKHKYQEVFSKYLGDPTSVTYKPAGGTPK